MGYSSYRLYTVKEHILCEIVIEKKILFHGFLSHVVWWANKRDRLQRNKPLNNDLIIKTLLWNVSNYRHLEFLGKKSFLSCLSDERFLITHAFTRIWILRRHHKVRPPHILIRLWIRYIYMIGNFHFIFELDQICMFFRKCTKDIMITNHGRANSHN